MNDISEGDTRSAHASDREFLEAVRALTKATELIADILVRRYPPANSELISAKEAAKLLQCSVRTLATYRDRWIEKAHFFPQSKGYKYNRILLEDWVKNQFDAAEHQRAIEQWVKQQPQNQSKPRGRKKV